MTKRNLLILLCVALAIGGVVSWFASPHPDGLERIAIDHEFESAAQAPLFEILPDYTVPGVEGVLSTTVAGLLGTLATFGLVLLIGKVMRAKRSRE